MTFLVLMNIYLIGGIMFTGLHGWHYIQEDISQVTGNDDDIRDYIKHLNQAYPKVAKATELDDTELGVNMLKDAYQGEHGKLLTGIVYAVLLTVFTLIWPIAAVSEINYKMKHRNHKNDM